MTIVGYFFLKKINDVSMKEVLAIIASISFLLIFLKPGYSQPVECEMILKDSHLLYRGYEKKLTDYLLRRTDTGLHKYIGLENKII